VGTPEQVVEGLRELEGLGLGYAIGYFVDAAYDPGSIDLFASQVIPELT
jgi:alkanesulfonate monooxygenase SsuD/methylene tetrahydromethanopterin reductase-like flavin-dependent oxidoreductase (luciferase family)